MESTRHYYLHLQQLAHEMQRIPRKRKVVLNTIYVFEVERSLALTVCELSKTRFDCLYF